VTDVVLELREVAGDDAHVEPAQDGFLGLADEKEVEAAADEVLGPLPGAASRSRSDLRSVTS